MKRRTRFAGFCLLALVLVAAAAVEGTARFSGPRWNPQLPPPTMPAAPTQGGRQPHDTGPALQQPHPTLILDPTVITGIILLVTALIVAALIWRWLRQRPTRFTATVPIAGRVLPGEQTDMDDEPDAEMLAPIVRRGLARALEVLDEHRPPSDAIVAAWLGLQEAAEDSGIHRRRAETPAEFTARIIRRAGADPGAATTLLRLYQDVRFGGIPATAADVQRARTSLRSLAAAWHPEGASVHAGLDPAAHPGERAHPAGHTHPDGHTSNPGATGEEPR